MSTVQRQQALLVAEAWQNLYTSQSYVDFQSYSQDNLVNAILNYVQVNYPDSYNDWTTNSEFVIKVRTLAWLHQNLSYRIDLDVRENFIQTATRREAILMLADNVFYQPNRVTGASGELRVDSVRCNQPIVDSNGDSLQNVEIFWNDPANADWFEQFMLVMNAALTPRTQFGHPLARFNNPPTRIDSYMFNSRAPSNGVYPFTVTVAGAALQFGYINCTLDKNTGVLKELAPNPNNALRILYRNDGRGSGSANTGFFLPIRQGTMLSVNQTFTVPQPMQQVIVGTANVDNTGIFVQQLDSAGNVALDWTEVDSVFGHGVSFNTLDSDIQTIFETHTLLNDQVRVQFGDGKYGAIPTDTFRFWYRVVNPTTISVQPTDIPRQNFTIPYIYNGTLYFLTIRASLVAPITNALPTDSNDTIKNNMGGAFAAQNRMVTNADYNFYPAQDPSILKVKTVNRTYAGHSAYARITDPTGYYDSVRVLGEDGRLYRNDTLQSQLISGLTSQITLDEILEQFLTPMIQGGDKYELYYTRYNEILTTDNPIWSETSVVDGVSQGRFVKNGIVIPVGATATDEFKYLVPGTLIRYTSVNGPLVTVQHVVGDGTAANSIILTDKLDTGTQIYSIMPPLRNQFTNEEASAVKAQLFNLQDFGLSWNQDTQKWTIITNANLDKAGTFDLANQSDAANTGRDGSWLVYFHYIPNAEDGPQWEVVNRGMGIYFESSRDVDFVYVNFGSLVDPYTGKLVRDNINILGSNEGRDSLHRLGLFAIGPCCALIYDFTADGVTECYQIRNRVDRDHVFVLVDDTLVIVDLDFALHETPVGLEVCFFDPPVAGASISIRVNGAYQFATQYLVSTTADGITTFFPIGSQRVAAQNTFLAVDGVSQAIGDYTTAMQGNIAGFFVTPRVRATTRVQGYALAGPTSDIFQVAIFVGDGTTTRFDVGFQNQTLDTIVVMIEGVWQSAGLDYSIDNTGLDSTVVFVTAPGDGANVVIHVPPEPKFLRSAMFVSVANGLATTFHFPNFENLQYKQVMVGLNGIVQRQGDYTLTDTGIVFAVAPLNLMRVEVFVVYGAVGFNFLDDDNTCFTTYLRDDKIWNTAGLQYTPDGYVDVNGVEVTPIDDNLDGIPDDPYEFDEILIADGVTDLVLWRTVVEDGFSVWNPIDETTVPKGTYGFSRKTGIIADTTYDHLKQRAGDIHYDQTTKTWLIADDDSGKWIVAPDQDGYKSAVGRSGLKFIWTHYPADNTRIDPAISNIMDMFILPVAYDSAYRQWIVSGFVGDAPLPPTSESLQNDYAYLNEKRMTDDSIIFHPINYKPLFGKVAETPLKGTFLAIKGTASNLSDNDLVLRIIRAIDVFFRADNWDLGESFYLTELIAFVHRSCAPDLQSIVLVAKDGSQFGDLFQIRCASDELFISVAQPLDVKIVSSFNSDNLQM